MSWGRQKPRPKGLRSPKRRKERDKDPDSWDVSELQKREINL